MKIQTSKTSLLAALATVKPAAANSGLPILSHVLVKANANSLTLACTNLDQSITASIGARVKPAGACTCRISILTSLLKSLPEDSSDDLTITVKDSTLSLTCDGISFDLGTMPAADFPPIPKLDARHTVEIAEPTLSRLLAGVVAAVSDDESRFVLTGALLSFSVGPRFVATDGKRLHLARADAPKADCEFILPVIAMQELIKSLSDDESHQATIRICDNQAEFQLQACTLRTKLIEGNFPNHKQVIPNPRNTVKLKRDDLLAAIERMAIVGENCTLAFAKDALEISALNDPQSKLEPCSIRQTISIQAPKPMQLRVNSTYLIQAMQSAGANEILVDYGDPEDPLMITTPDDEYLAVIMPMRAQ